MDTERSERAERANKKYTITLVAGGQYTMSPAEVRNQLQPEGTLEECEKYLNLCMAYGADPRQNDLHFIKYRPNDKPKYISGIGFYEKKAQLNPKFRGFGRTEYLVLSKEDGATPEWSEFFLRDFHKKILACKVRVHVEGFAEQEQIVTIEECQSSGPTWKAMPATMLEKTTKVRILRKLFAVEFAGLYTSEEMGTDIEEEARRQQDRIVKEMELKDESEPESDPAAEDEVRAAHGE